MGLRFLFNKIKIETTKFKIYHMNKKGLSGIIVTMILIAITMAVVVIVWTIVNNLVEEQTEKAASCFGIFEKVTIDDKYTCYNYNTNEIQFSINIVDVEVDEILISISASSGSKNFRIKSDEEIINNLRYYSGSYNSPVKLPDKDGGTTYIFNWTNALYPGSEKNSVNQIKIAPMINQKQCEPSDSATDIVNCEILVF